ncbi:hypothetical protein [Paractinoplanes globisporus]|uniref:Uncharacterized protein n=1 Tax=Paractinoplanes globisporus TaxID=113565 RepID=A0ABW6WMX1_9ACTN|nr:hypothetical protein [Actinoplanes globisporus]
MNRAVLVLAPAGALLAVAGAFLYPAALGGGGYLGLAGAVVAPAVCVVLLRWGPTAVPAAPAVAARIGATAGLIAGALYAAEGLAEYLSAGVTDASVTIGWIIVGGLVTATVIAAATASVRVGTVRAGVIAAVHCAVSEYLVWYPAVLIAYYAFRNSGAIERVWRAEGIYDDFARSGMSDIRAFVLQDFWGAGFFHLLAGLVIAGIFGTLAALAGRLGLRLRPAGSATRPG